MLNAPNAILQPLIFLPGEKKFLLIKKHKILFLAVRFEGKRTDKLISFEYL